MLINSDFKMAEKESLVISVPLGNEECQIEMSLPSVAFNERAWPKRAAAVLSRRLVASHGLPCYVQGDIEGVLQFHMDKLSQVLSSPSSCSLNDCLHVRVNHKARCDASWDGMPPSSSELDELASQFVPVRSRYLCVYIQPEVAEGEQTETMHRQLYHKLMHSPALVSGPPSTESTLICVLLLLLWLLCCCCSCSCCTVVCL